MSQPRQIKQLVSAGDMSASITSNAYDVSGQSNIGLELVYTGTPTGTFSVECSNDATKNDGSNGTWIALTFGTALTAPAGAGGSFLINLNQLPYAWVRVKYTRSAGTGTLNVWICAKGLA